MLPKISSFLSRCFIEEQWCIGFVPSRVVSSSATSFYIPDSEVTWLDIPKSYFLADPTWLNERKGQILCEYFHFAKRRGQLARVCLKGSSVEKLDVLNSASFHYSYPQIYISDGKYRIIPESAADNCLKELIFDPEKARIVRENVLIQNSAIVDPCIFEFEGKYWMFCNPLKEFNTTLLVYSAKTFAELWSADPRFYKISNCRGAGKLFMKGGELYWPTQVNTSTYGGGVLIRKVMSLTESEFEYEDVYTIHPDPNGKYPHGLHSIEFGEELCLLDGKRRNFNLLKFANVIVSKLRRF